MAALFVAAALEEIVVFVCAFDPQSQQLPICASVVALGSVRSTIGWFCFRLAGLPAFGWAGALSASVRRLFYYWATFHDTYDAYDTSFPHKLSWGHDGGRPAGQGYWMMKMMIMMPLFQTLFYSTSSHV